MPLPGFIDSFTSAFLTALIVIVMGRPAMVIGIRWLNWSVWSDDLCAVPSRRVTGLLIFAEALLPFLMVGGVEAAVEVQVSLGWTQPAIVFPAAVLAGLLVTLPAYALFLTRLMGTTVLRALAIQSLFMTLMLAAFGVAAAVFIGLRHLASRFPATGFP